MKKVKCGKCNQVLGVPTKLFGKDVQCPNCNKLLRIRVDKDSKRSKKSSVAKIKAGVPVATQEQVTVRGGTPFDDFEDVSNLEDAPEAIPVVAKIIETSEPIQEMVKEGELPRLQLTEQKNKNIEVAEKQTSPVLIGLLVCFSLLMSGLILVFGDFQPKVDLREMEKARQELTRFYTVSIDIPLQPYQRLLREAQLAHSKDDRDAEVAAYRKVMEMFREEDRSKFKGVTGSPTSDAELEYLVSIMLGKGRESPTRLIR